MGAVSWVKNQIKQADPRRVKVQALYNASMVTPKSSDSSMD